MKIDEESKYDIGDWIESIHREKGQITDIRYNSFRGFLYSITTINNKSVDYTNEHIKRIISNSEIPKGESKVQVGDIIELENVKYLILEEGTHITDISDMFDRTPSYSSVYILRLQNMETKEITKYKPNSTERFIIVGHKEKIITWK